MTTRGGLLLAGTIHAVEGLVIANPLDTPSWCKLSPGDYKQRKTTWTRQIIWHTTKGIAKQHVKPGAGATNREKIVADFWRGDPQHSAAQIVIGSDGEVACLCDLAYVAAYHATTSNDISIGVEVYQEADGGIYEAALRAVRILAPALAALIDMPHQVHIGPYERTIVKRMLHGGADCVGHFGHRDQAWKFPWQIDDARTRAKYPEGYANRGAGDPGEFVMGEIFSSGAEGFDYSLSTDRITWIPRQLWLATVLGERKVTPDGVCGPITRAAMRAHGFEQGRDIDASMASAA